jgi:hypothetical protein
MVEPVERYMTNSSITENKIAKDYPTSHAYYREIGIAAVAAALCCEHMPAPNDERADKHAHESSWTDRLA